MQHFWQRCHVSMWKSRVGGISICLREVTSIPASWHPGIPHSAFRSCVSGRDSSSILLEMRWRSWNTLLRWLVNSFAPLPDSLRRMLPASKIRTSEIGQVPKISKLTFQNQKSRFQNPSIQIQIFLTLNQKFGLHNWCCKFPNWGWKIRNSGSKNIQIDVPESLNLGWNISVAKSKIQVPKLRFEFAKLRFQNPNTDVPQSETRVPKISKHPQWSRFQNSNWNSIIQDLRLNGSPTQVQMTSEGHPTTEGSWGHIHHL